MKILVQIALTFFVFFTACKPTRTFLAEERVSQYRMQQSDTLVADPSVEQLILPYRTKLESQMNVVIGRTAQELKLGQPVSLLGTWAAETLHNQAIKYYGKNIDFTTANQNGLRIKSLPKGDITIGKIFELMPFDNLLVVIIADSMGVDRYIRHMASRGGWPIAGASYDIRNDIVENIKIGNEILRGGKNYTFAVPDYIANGGDNCDFLKVYKRQDLAKLIRDAFIEGIKETTKQGKLLDAKMDNRVNIIKN